MDVYVTVGAPVGVYSYISYPFNPQGVLQPDFEMVAHRQVACTISPGRYLCDVIKTNSHYSSKPVRVGC